MRAEETHPTDRLTGRVVELGGAVIAYIVERTGAALLPRRGVDSF